MKTLLFYTLLLFVTVIDTEAETESVDVREAIHEVVVQRQDLVHVH